MKRYVFTNFSSAFFKNNFESRHKNDADDHEIIMRIMLYKSDHNFHKNYSGLKYFKRQLSKKFFRYEQHIDFEWNSV